MKKSLIFCLLVAFVCLSCASNYDSYKGRIGRAVMPKDFFELAQDIQTSKLQTLEKTQLNVELVRRSIHMLEVYIKVAIDDDRLPDKKEILEMLSFLKENLDKGLDKDLEKQLKEAIKRFSIMLFE